MVPIYLSVTEHMTFLAVCEKRIRTEGGGVKKEKSEVEVRMRRSKEGRVEDEE